MITTFDILPSVEYIYDVDKFIPLGNMNAKDINIHILSKPIYASKAIRILQGEAVFIGMLGGFAGKYTKHHMDKTKIKSDVTWTDTQTPHEIVIVDNNTNGRTVITQSSTQINEKDLNQLEQKVRTYIKRTTTLVIEGKLPNSISPNIYSRLIQEAKRYNVKTLLSTGDKEVLLAVAQQMPYSIMFTLRQLEDIGIDTTDVEGIVVQLGAYLSKGVHYIGVDLESQGGLLLSKNKLCYMEPVIEMQHHWTSTFSAAFLGAIAVGIDRKYEQEKIAKLAMASALAAQKGKGVYTKSNIDKLLKKVKIRELSKTLLNPIQNKYLRVRMGRPTV